MIKKIKLPAILLSHDLGSGELLFWNGKNWEANFAKAKIAHTQIELENLAQIAAQQIQTNLIVEPEIVELWENNFSPRHNRERIKINGPTIEFMDSQNSNPKGNQNVSI